MSFPITLNSQCERSIIKNGSFELDSVGAGITGKYWTSIIGSPDIENAGDDIYTPNSNLSWSDEVLNSSNGGNWQIIGLLVSYDGEYSYESFGQEIHFKRCIPHTLEFEFTALNFRQNIRGNGFLAIDVFINDDLIHTTEVDSTLFTFEPISVTFTPKTKVGTISFRINQELNYEPYPAFKFAAIDGICIRPNVMEMFCKP